MGQHWFGQGGIAAQPEHANAQYEYGKIFMYHGDVHGAVAHLRIAACWKPNIAFVHYQLQAAYRQEREDRELGNLEQIRAEKHERAAKRSWKN
jgi:hypothetical protein